ncbi:hypothetical protein BC829DRAFT_396850 [Chytridium lagenaria]|nr:hypothetical protein BC829DRAFT_396850 [Chytridium lagenaria]
MSNSLRPQAPTYGHPQGQQQLYTEQDLQNLVDKTLDVQSESVRVTQQAASAALEAQRIAQQAASKLGRQGEQLNGINQRLDQVQSEFERADKKATHLVQLNNRPFFIPVGSKVAKASEAANHRPPPQQDAQSSATSSSSWFSWLGFSGDAPPPQDTLSAPEIKPRTSSMVEYEAKVGEWATREEQERSKGYEREIDEGLDQVSSALDTIGQETQRQNEQLREMTSKVEANQDMVIRSIRR